MDKTQVRPKGHSSQVYFHSNRPTPTFPTKGDTMENLLSWQDRLRFQVAFQEDELALY